MIKMTNMAMPSEFSNYKKVLNRIKLSGEQPTMTLFFERLDVNPNQFYNSYNYNKAPWTLEIKDSYETLQSYWEKNGGIEAKKLKKALQVIQARGEKPNVTGVCHLAGIQKAAFLKQQYSWKWKILNKIELAKKKYSQGIYNSKYNECINVINKLVEANEIPTKIKVATQAGYSKRLFFDNIDIPWKQKILGAIEKSYEGYEKINPFFVDSDKLIEKIDSRDTLDYSRIGMSLKLSKTGEIKYFNLARVMYENQVIGSATGKGIADVYADLKSYRSERKVYIDGIIMACEGKTNQNIRPYISYMVYSALWLGNNIPKSVNDARKSFFDQAYVLERLLKSGETSYQISWYRQQGLLKLLSGMFSAEETVFTQDYTHLLIPNTAPKSNVYSNTAKFTQKELSYAFAFYYHLFKQISEILLENKSFPQSIELPAGKAVVLGLGNTLIATEKTKNGNKAIDYTDGHVLSDEEIYMLAEEEAINTSKTIAYTKRFIFKAKEKALLDLEKINSNQTHPKRLQIGKKALDAWYMCMLFFTAMNDSTLGSLRWGDDNIEFEAEERKEFVNIKPRAKYKNVRFPLPKSCLKDFEKFLRLRRFVLNGNTVENLFFMHGYGDSARIAEGQLIGKMSATIKREMIRQIDSELPAVTSRSSRRDNARDALQEHGLETALSVLQNTSNVFIDHYNGETAEEMASGVSNFLKSMHDTVTSDDPINKKEEHAMGGCKVKGLKEPVTFSKDSPIKANCDDPKSCIFCEYYVTFPETEYIRKLLSLQYIIENTAYDRAENENFYDKEMKPWLDRIEYILNQMKEKEPKSEQVIEIVIEEVNDGLLSPYWLLWSEIFEDLGRFA